MLLTRAVAGCLLTAALLINVSHGRDVRKSFNTLAPTNVTGIIGEVVELPCSLSDSNRHGVISWIRRRDFHILAVGRYIYTTDDRFSMRHYDYENTWYLSITPGRATDAGDYECMISTDDSQSLTRVMSLTMIEKSDNLYWRADSRCGAPYYLSGALSSTVAECDPDGVYPCCSSANWCGFSYDHCNCGSCVDYRLRRRNAPTTMQPEIERECPPMYEKLGDKCVFVGDIPFPWEDSDQFCREHGGQLITFQSLDEVVEMMDNLTRRRISELGGNGLEDPFWVGLSIRGQESDDELWEWSWTADDQETDQFREVASGDDGDDDSQRCRFLRVSSKGNIRHSDDCTTLKLPLCEYSSQP